MNEVKKVYIAFSNLSTLTSCKTMDDAVKEFEVVFENGTFFWVKRQLGHNETEVIKMKRIYFYAEKDLAKKKIVTVIKGYLELAEKLRKLLPV